MLKSHHSRKYTLNEDFFSSWSPSMAYVLGFWYADGNIQHIRSYRVRFYSNDLDHLITLKSILDSGNPVTQRVRRGIIENCFCLTVHSKKLFKSLVKLGAETNKSTTLVFPLVPYKYLRDFIRGYFDGDGSVHTITYKATKNGKYYTEIRSNFTCGSKKFLETLREKLHINLRLANRIIGQYGPHQFKLAYGQKDTYKLLRYMYYSGHPASLRRKANYLNKFPLKLR